MANEKKETGCCTAGGSNIIFTVAVVALIIGFAGGYLLKPVGAEENNGGSFVPDDAKIEQLRVVMEKLVLLNTGEQSDVSIDSAEVKTIIRVVLSTGEYSTIIYLNESGEAIVATENEQISSLDSLETEIDSYLAQQGLIYNGGSSVVDGGTTKTCWEQAAEDLDLDLDLIKTTFEQNYNEVMVADAQKTAERGVSGSPTLFINGETYSGSRTHEAYMNAICSYFTEKPTECEGYGNKETEAKSEVPVVELYVVSECPYGDVAVNAIKDAVVLLEDKIDFEPVYIIKDYNGDGTYDSMHGQAELDQGIREKTVYNLYGEGAWAEYTYIVNGGCTGNYSGGANAGACG